MTSQTTEKTTKNVLVIGDWPVDENWITATHNSKTSNRIGDEHNIITPPENWSIWSFCAAALTTRFIYKATWKSDNGGTKPFKVIGMGLWHRRDSKILWTLLKNWKPEGPGTPYRLENYVKTSDPDNQTLINLGSLITLLWKKKIFDAFFESLKSIYLEESKLFQKLMSFNSNAKSAFNSIMKESMEGIKEKVATKVKFEKMFFSAEPEENTTDTSTPPDAAIKETTDKEIDKKTKSLMKHNADTNEEEIKTLLKATAHICESLFRCFSSSSTPDINCPPDKENREESLFNTEQDQDLIKTLNFIKKVMKKIKTEDLPSQMIEKIQKELEKELSSGDNIPKKTIEKIIENLEGIPPLRIGTTRIIRFFRKQKDGLKLDRRVDWEPGNHVWDNFTNENGFFCNPTKTYVKEWIKKNVQKRLKESDHHEPNAVVINDLGKGLIATPLIECLAELYHDKEWFIMSKTWNPDWFETLRYKKVMLRLLVVPPAAARGAIREIGFTNWFANQEHPSREAHKHLKIFEQNLAPHFRSVPVFAVLPGGTDMIVKNCRTPDCPPNDKCRMPCCETREKKETVLTHKEKDDDAGLRDIAPIPDIFFSALTAYMVQNTKSTEETEESIDIIEKNENLIKEAFSFTWDWIKEMNDCFMSNDFKKIHGYNLVIRQKINEQTEESRKTLEPEDVNGGTPPDRDKPVNELKDELWYRLDRQWEQAENDCGIITHVEEKKDEIQLWRSMVEVEGYVCCAESKRKKLRKVIEHINDFKENRKSSVSFMLIAPPGSGKTFMMKCLAKKLSLQLLSFNITQMLSRTDLIDSFDTIGTTQSQLKDNPLLIFIDEINATLQNETVYDAFLAPIEEEIYIRGGKRFTFSPCIWIFAGTDLNSNMNISNKVEDLKSRLTLPPIDLTANDDDLGYRIEKVYLGSKLLYDDYPDVMVSKAVLELFRDLCCNFGMRKMKSFVKAFEGINNGKITLKNVPFKWIEDRCEDPSSSLLKRYKEQAKDTKKLEDNMIRISK